MKTLLGLLILLLPVQLLAQKHTPLPHGMVFGIKPNTVGMMDASKLEPYMDKEIRTSTTIKGKVLRVTKTQGGWFDIGAGNGKVIAAHFKSYNITIPTDLAGRTVIVEGVAQKQFIADDMQHIAGDTVTGKKQHKINVDPKRRLTFEVKGLVVDK